jgi:hypothetical protein
MAADFAEVDLAVLVGGSADTVILTAMAATTTITAVAIWFVSA